jgi:hypothetical protein
MMLGRISPWRLAGGIVALLLVVFLLLPAIVNAARFVIKDQSSCEALGGSWNTLEMCVIDTLRIDVGNSLAIRNVWLRVDGELEVAGRLDSSGVIDLVGHLQVAPGGEVINHTLLTVRPSGSVENRALIENLGEIANGGLIDNVWGAVDNKCLGVITGHGFFSGNDPLNVPGSLVCTGSKTFLPVVAP